ncbi:MAG: hypothetical protein NVS2B3_05400 [Vulcanimicrobiaceae bacterium]
MQLTQADPDPALWLLPEVDVRALLVRPRLALRILRPPYPALGLGVLRVLRVRARGDVTEIVAGYEGYERLADRIRPLP